MNNRTFGQLDIMSVCVHATVDAISETKWGSSTPWILARMSSSTTGCERDDDKLLDGGDGGGGGGAGVATWRSLEAASRETRTEKEQGSSSNLYPNHCSVL